MGVKFFFKLAMFSLWLGFKTVTRIPEQQKAEGSAILMSYLPLQLGTISYARKTEANTFWQPSVEGRSQTTQLLSQQPRVSSTVTAVEANLCLTVTDPLRMNRRDSVDRIHSFQSDSVCDRSGKANSCGP